MIELLFLLLPVAAAYGYVMGKNNANNEAQQQNQQIINEYSKGLKFLLDREEDQGLEHLISLLEISANSVEHYLTLATLFRRRGELDRAIKVHELLLKHNSLSLEQKKHVLYELAQDYMMAGLLDRAEDNLVYLYSLEDDNALCQLMLLYLQSHDWDKGIALFELKHIDFKSSQLKKTIANFYCEKALLERNFKQLDEISDLTQDLVRPKYMLGENAFNEGDYLQAIKYWGSLLDKNTAFAPIFLDKLELSYEKLNLQKNYFSHLLKHLKNDNVLIKIHYCKNLMAQGKVDEAINYITQVLRKQPNIRGFSFLLTLMSEQSQDIKVVLTEINKLVQDYIATKALYQCNHCGFTSKKLYWFCPSCKHVESLVPLNGVDGF
ncbi:lipopolysaccharide assembly protein LapB [Pseudoalteromonas sp.]|uniref:lipopolysaccharide assembly protein LapB n=1 Tax=Pseudoalteromonas sp. TaxID=53249 RepID=UPI0035652B0B